MNAGLQVGGDRGLTGPEEGWALACRAAALLALDSAGLGGVLLRAPPGEARTAWLALAKSLTQDAGGPIVQAPASVTAEQLLGGLDLERTLALGRPAAQRGALARADGGLLLLAMAERAPAGTAALIAAALDSHEAGGERDGVSSPEPARFGLVALDESLDGEDRPQAVLRERLALEIDLTACHHRDIGDAPSFDLADARQRLPSVVTPDGAIESLCAAAFALGIDSGRAPLLALRTARANAALAGRTIVSEEDVLLAARLVLAHRARHLPQGERRPRPRRMRPRPTRRRRTRCARLRTRCLRRRRPRSRPAS